ncbi:MAG: PHP domain-containing protein [Oscillospiraceae bacterium]|nr:PHP domain-containing protein [Oscillospiraceae bacterium]
MKYIDLHLHSTVSDGTVSPRGLVEEAAELGLAAISVTDHDSVGGVAEALAAGAELGVEVVPGIEVSSDYLDNNVHILGYYIDPAASSLRPVLDWVATERNERNEKIVAMLAAAGYDISMAALRAAYPGAVLGRPHFCEYLMHRGYIRSVKEGFDTLLGTGCPFYLPKRRLSIEKAVESIRNAGGIPVLAHPMMYGYDRAGIGRLLDTVTELGIRHVEAYYSENSPEDETWLLAEGERRGFGITGGSDYHGSRKPHIRMGSGKGGLRVPESVLQELKKYRDLA